MGDATKALSAFLALVGVAVREMDNLTPDARSASRRPRRN